MFYFFYKYYYIISLLNLQILIYILETYVLNKVLTDDLINL